MTGHDAHMANLLEAHDNPPCSSCGVATWIGDLDDDERCPGCAAEHAQLGEQ